MSTFLFQPTPNPNSLKITREGHTFMQEGMLTASTVEEAEGCPPAQALLRLEGVANVFVVPAFLTVTRTPGADWDRLIPALEKRLAAFA